jgi:hypothetical protein
MVFFWGLSWVFHIGNDHTHYTDSDHLNRIRFVWSLFRQVP